VAKVKLPPHLNEILDLDTPIPLKPKSLGPAELAVLYKDKGVPVHRFAHKELLAFVSKPTNLSAEAFLALNPGVSLDPGIIGVLFPPIDGDTSFEELKCIGLDPNAPDQLVGAMFKKLALNGVPLGVPEVDAALTSGKINACYGSPVAAVALQWYSKVKYMTSMPMSFAIGATVVSAEGYKKLSAEDAKVIEDISKANAKKLRKVIRKANEDAKGTMSRKGVTVVQTPIAMVDEFTKSATELWTELAGKIYSKEELKMVLDARDEYRAKHKKGTP